MTDARVSSARANVLAQPVPAARVSSAQAQVLAQPVPATQISRAMVQVLSRAVASAKPYIRTVGSTRAVQMKQPDGTWWSVRAME